MKGKGNLTTAALFVVLLLTYCGFAIALHNFQPFTSIASNSMQPALSRGDLVLIKKTSHSTVKVGDIIAFSVPDKYRKDFGYPGVLSHRVIRIENDPSAGIIFWTKGDATEIDPFGVPANALRGRIVYSVPWVGHIFLFLRSLQGIIFLIATVIFYLLYRYGNTLSEKWKDFQGIFKPKASPELLEELRRIEDRQDNVQQALNSFAAAMAEYGKHIESHVEAVKSMAEASRELKEVAKDLAKTVKGVG